MIKIRSTRKQLKARYAKLERALDQPWTYEGDKTDQELYVEQSFIAEALGKTSFPGTRKS
jgi:hypothetical protein